MQQQTGIPTRHIMSNNSRIDSWRHSIPSRFEREDPFANDGFEPRCSTRLTFREDSAPTRDSAPSSRLGQLLPRFARPVLGSGSTPVSPSTADDRPTAEATRGKKRKRDRFRSLLRRERGPPPPPAIHAPLKLRFLFVGDRGSGQTALLYHAKYGHFPDTSAIPRTPFETYMLEKDGTPVVTEL
ncbi:uncharacterized protein UV8b_05589 [Ustilaginoidea virens]|uniref:Uncharacterized protein n=1 Tax=Ustilaginoidea virens TaxID=1159556 RepID=A0A8E5MIT2_USTVR|nr:uncharacterized protein UV8b_05589 [Ustilaginoidea virens]QUC21346.1 hypothetical protein UV8b_05589 [Ustilaginoidea virens]